ncbi:MAG: hypothetical protein R3345_00070, partial [Fulvivirga sp.]|nr:hypothetical protein [Fulvivirga sp.]
GIQFNKKDKLNGSFQIGFGTINDEDRDFISSNSSTASANKFFKTNFFYVNYSLHYNLIKKENLIVYISQGIGFLRFTPTDQFGDNLQDQPGTREEGETYRNASIMLPTSVGAIYLLPNQYGIGLQAGFYGTLTDYLDNISQLAETNNDNILGIRFAFYIPVFQGIE